MSQNSKVSALLFTLVSISNTFCFWGTTYQTDTEKYKQLHEDTQKKINAQEWPKADLSELSDPEILEKLIKQADCQNAETYKYLIATIKKCLEGKMPAHSTLNVMRQVSI